MPNSTDSTGLFELARYVTNNNCSGGLLFPVIMLVIAVVIFMTLLSRTTASKAFTTAAFITFVLSLSLSVLNMVAPKYMYLSLLCLAFGAFWIKLEDDTG